MGNCIKMKKLKENVDIKIIETLLMMNHKNI